MNHDRLLKEYLSKQGLYKELSEAFKGLIESVLSGEKIKVYRTDNREKDPARLEEKILRKESKGKKYESLNEIEDLAGVRVVTYLDSHKEVAVNAILGEFESSCLRIEQKYDPQGYRGTHLILTLGDARENLAEYAHFKGLKCEVQVSSILYHAWSEIEHDVIYKPGGDREKLNELGLAEIEKSFQELMAEHLEEATIQFDLLFKKHQEVLEAGSVIFSDYILEIKSTDSNEKIYSVLDIAHRFSDKKPGEALQIAEAVLDVKPNEPNVIGTFGGKEILGKENDQLVQKSIEIFNRTRYWDVVRVLSSLFRIVDEYPRELSDQALQVIKDTVRYDSVYIKKRKDLYPQVAALKHISSIPAAQQEASFESICAVIIELVSSAAEGTEWRSEDSLTIHRGALIPNEGLKKLRKDAFDFTVDLHSRLSDPGNRFRLTQAILSSLSLPHHGEHGNELIEMIQEDAAYLSGPLDSIVFSNGEINDYPLAQEVEKSISFFLRNERLESEGLRNLRDRIRVDAGYVGYRTLVGDIFGYKGQDEEWNDAESRRSEEVDRLVVDISEANIEEWYEKLNRFAEPYASTIVEDWPYQTFGIFVSRLTDKKPEIAAALLHRAVVERAPLASRIFVNSYLGTLRNNLNFEAWDSFVALMCKENSSGLIGSALFSLNINNELDLKESIRDEDIEILNQIIEKSGPFGFVDESSSHIRFNVGLALTRVFRKDPNRIEALIVEEMKRYPDHALLHFRELPFARSRGWMSFREWSPDGVEFIGEQLVLLPNLDWHIQGMMLDLGDNPIGLVLNIFKSRIAYGTDLDTSGYEQIPHHFNPDLQEYLAGHESYVEEMTKWLEEMTPEWSSYNWHTSQLIQRIGGPSYSTILLKLIEKGDDDSLLKATYALNRFEGADFTLCFEIVRRTENEEILGRVLSAMSGTGVVSGEDGLVKAFERKASELENYVKSENDRVRDFAINTKKKFEEDIVREKERSIVGSKRRRLEFNG